MMPSGVIVVELERGQCRLVEGEQVAGRHAHRVEIPGLGIRAFGRVQVNQSAQDVLGQRS